MCILAGLVELIGANHFNAYGQKRMDSWKSKLVSTVDTLASKSDGKFPIISFVPMRAKGPPKDSVEQFTWLPKQFKDSNALPENMKSFGCPWYHGGRGPTWRWSGYGLPIGCMGGFLMHDAGQFVVVAWSHQTMLEEDIGRAAAWNFYGMMGSRDFEKRKEELWHCELKSKTVVWIPPTWNVCVFATADVNDFHSFVWQPVLSGQLLTKVSQPLMDSLVEDCIQWQKSNKGEPYDSFLSGYKAWLEAQGCREPGERPVGAAQEEEEEAEDSDADELGLALGSNDGSVAGSGQPPAKKARVEDTMLDGEDGEDIH